MRHAVLVMAALAVMRGAFGSDAKVESYKLKFAERAAEPPVIDGRLDDACWKRATPIDDFGPCTIAQEPARNIPRTEIRLAWDEKYLYVAATCYEDTPENMESFRKVIADEKRVIFTRDCIELHIDGNNDEHTTFQCWMAACPEKAIHWNWDFGWGLLTDGNYGLNADWQSAYSIGKDSWTVEARYAMSHFELKPQVGYMFGLEPARFRYEKKLYTPDMKETLKGGGMWLGWGSQGKNHHNADGYGKVVLVEREPASVAEGLKLAYADFDRRVIYVQTGSEYAVFDHGRESALTYAEKAKALVAETERLVARMDGFVDSASDACGKHAKAQLAEFRKTRAAFLKAKEALAAAKRVTVAMITDLTAKTEGWNSKFDDLYWQTVLALFKVEKSVRVPAKLNPPADAPALNSEEDWSWFRPEERNAPFVPWAKPLAAKRPRVFITIDSQGGYDAWALVKRLDLDAEIFQSTGGRFGVIGVTRDYFNEGLWFVPKKRAELERALKERGPFDAYLFLGCSTRIWPAELQCWLWERINEGAKVVVENGGDLNAMPFGQFPKQADLVKGVPGGMVRLEGIPRTLRAELVPASLEKGPLTVCPFGKGSYAAFDPGKRGGYVHTSVVTPAWALPNDRLFEDEYCFAYAVRCIMQGLGLREGRRAVSVCGSLATVESDRAFTAALETKGDAPWTGEVGWLVRDASGRGVQPMRYAKVKLPAGTSHVSLAVDACPAGRYTVDAFLYADGRKVVDFAAGAVEAKPLAPFVPCGCAATCKEMLEPAKFADFKLLTPTLNRPDSKVVAEIAVVPASTGLSVRAEIRDVRDRVLARRDVPVDPKTGKAKVEMNQVRNYDWTCAFLDLTLRHGERAVDSRSAPFYRHRGDANDYQIFCSPPGPGGYMGMQRLAMVQNYGVGLCQMEGNFGTASAPYFGGDLIFRDRIPGSAPDLGGSLSSKWWLKHLKARYRRHAERLREVNGRWVSLGDDSNAPLDFPKSVPDFVPAWTSAQIEWVRQESERLVRQGYARPTSVACANWYRKAGVPVDRCSDDLDRDHWGFKAYPKSNWRKVLDAVSTPEQLKPFVESFKAAYETVERFNVHAGSSFAKWEDITVENVKTLAFQPSPEWCNFLFWLREKYGDIARLNAVWGTDEKDFLTIRRDVIDECLLKRVYAPSIDMQRFLEGAFVGQCKAIADGIHSADPTIGLGFGASHLENTLGSALKHLDTVCPYVGNEDIEMARGLPHRYIGETIGIYGGRQVGKAMRYNQVWHGLFTGCNFSWYWDTPFISGDLTLNPGRHGWMLEAYREILGGPAALCIRSKRLNDGIRFLVSADSGHLNTLVNEMSSHPQARRVFAKVFESQGFQYDAITTEMVEKGGLDGMKAIVLPYAQVLTDKEVERIKAFVKAGGTVIGDARIATFDTDGRRLAKPLMDEVFGIVRKNPEARPVSGDVVIEGLTDAPATLVGATVDASVGLADGAKAYGCTADGAPAFIVNGYGRGQAVLLNFNIAVLPFLEGRNELGAVRGAITRLLGTVGLKTPFAMKGEDGKEIAGTEFTRFVRGDITCLAVEKTGFAFEKFPMQATVGFGGKPKHVYDIRKGRYLGEVDSFPMTLTGLDFEFFALLPYKVGTMRLAAPDKAVRGTDLVVKAEIAAADAGAKIGTHVFRVELLPPGGWTHERLLPFPVRVLDAKDGKLETSFPIAFNDEVGSEWKLVVTDVMSGVRAEKTVTVGK